MKDNFENLAAIIGFVLNAGGIATLIALLNSADTKAVVDCLTKAIGLSTSDRGLVSRRSATLAGLIFSPSIILLHLLNLTVFFVMGMALIVGPNHLFIGILPTALAQPLSTTEKIVFTLVLVILFLGYFSQCAMPSIKNAWLLMKSLRWLRKNNVTQQHR